MDKDQGLGGGVFENLSVGHILVLAVAGLFILGPERLPEAAAWLARTIGQVKNFASGAREQLHAELGPEFHELRKPLEELREPLAQLRELRNYDPRRAVTRALLDDNPPAKPNGFAPPPTPPTTYPAPQPPRRLGAGERPPIDPDAT